MNDRKRVAQVARQPLSRSDKRLKDGVIGLSSIPRLRRPDKDKGWLDLNGLKTRVRLKFGPAIARVPNENEPL